MTTTYDNKGNLDILLVYYLSIKAIYYNDTLSQSATNKFGDGYDTSSLTIHNDMGRDNCIWVRNKDRLLRVLLTLGK